MAKLFQYTNYIDYDELINKPTINKVTVEGDKSLDDYGIQPAGKYAHLNESGKVPLNEIDDSLLGNLQFQTTWDAKNNNPELPLIPEVKGQYWIVSNGGERFGLSFNNGDWIVATNKTWIKVDNTDSVSSVNKKVGNVVLTSKDIEHHDSTIEKSIDSKQNKLKAGKNIIIKNDEISAEFNTAIIDYNLTYNKPSINGVELINNKTLEDFDIQRTIKAGNNIYLTKSESSKMNDTVNVYDATENRKGVSQVASQLDITNGSDDYKYVTSKKLKVVTDEIGVSVANEIDRATKEEGSIKSLLNDEINRATAEENTIKQSLQSEIDRATAEENTISTEVALKANDADLKTVAKSGSYNDLIDKPTIPTKVSELDNDKNYLTTATMDNYALKTDLNKKQDTLTFDNVPTLNSENVVKSSGIKSAIDAKQDAIGGGNGEVIYHNGKNVFSQTLMNEGMIVMNDTDLNKCKNNTPSFSEVFNTWKKFSHQNGIDNAVPSEMSAWKYDESKDTIIQPINTVSYVGFVSPKTYSNYDITVRVYSDNDDNDTIGLIAAFAVDAQGKEHTLSFVRSPGGTRAKWICRVDISTFYLTDTNYNQITLEDKSSLFSDSILGWNSPSNNKGTYINIKREGNIITGMTSNFNNSSLREDSKIIIDLDELSAQYPILNLFKGSSSWGYSSFSQSNSMYENISMTNPDGYIYDIPHNQVLKYNNSSKSWNAMSGVTPTMSIGAGRLSYNKVTGKLFYCTGDIVFQIATNTDI